ncbi:alpha-1,2-fucosyltransferase, partial [Escherichia coli]|nr:alpha-1,2-fucosyltransferase [Escherichia coli]
MSIVVARLAGGLGNQMFQYAKGYAESVERNSSLKLDLRGYKNYTLHGGFRLDKLNIDNTFVMSKKEMCIFPNFIVRAINKFPKLSLCSKRFESEQYSKKINGSMKGSVEFIGFWQNERYFLEHKEKLREIFTPININLDAKELSDVIRCTNSVSVHIRRGDYVSNVEALKIHGLCTERYYID